MNHPLTRIFVPISGIVFVAALAVTLANMSTDFPVNVESPEASASIETTVG